MMGLCLIAFLAHGQNSMKGKEADREVETVDLDYYPKYPGGEEELYRYMAENVRYPDAARRMGIEGRVYIQFVVDKSGKVIEVVAIRGIGAGCDEEAIRVVKSMPAWEPGQLRGKPVNVQMVLPITFRLGDEGKKNFWQRLFGGGN